MPFLGPLTVYAEPIPASPTATPAQQAALTASVGGVAANTPTPNNIGGPQADGDVNKVMMWIMSIFAWFLGVAAIILDYSVYYTVVKMGDYIHSLSAVATVWRILRDIGNIVLIFGFVAMGIETIINTNFYGNVSKRLPTLLIVAVLLNFSLFFTEAIIDVGNLFATQFYSQIFDGKNIPPPSAVFQAGAAQESISNAILQQLHLTQLYGDAIQNKAAFTGQLFIGVLGCILFIIASFVMLSLAFILIARFIALIFLIIVAPIGFAGLIVPKLEKTAKDWWSMLVNQTLTAPILMLMLYIALSVILSKNFLPGFGITAAQGASFTGFLTNSAPGFGGFGSIILSFIVAMGLLLGVTVLAKKMSAVGAGAATKLAGTLSGAALVMGAPGALGRNTIGRGSNALNQSLLKSSFGRTALGRQASRALTGAANRKFDFRNTNVGKAVEKELAGRAGLTLGAGAKEGFSGNLKKAIESREKYSKELKQTDDEKQQQKMLETMAQADRENAAFDQKALAAKQREERNKAQTELKNLEGVMRAAETKAAASQADATSNSWSPERKSTADADAAALQAAKQAYADAAARAEPNKMKERHEEETTALKNKHDQNIAETDSAVQSVKNAPRAEYAEMLEGQWYLSGAQGAAKKIKEDLNKKQSDKDRERLQKLLESADAPATPPPPAAK